MTYEQLQKANNISDKIKELESFKKAFNNGYVNFIKAVDHSGSKPCTKTFDIHSGGELHKIINDYIAGRLKEM